MPKLFRLIFTLVYLGPFSVNISTGDEPEAPLRFAVIGDFGFDNYKPKSAAVLAKEKAESAKKTENNEDDDDDLRDALSAGAGPALSTKELRNPFEAGVAKLVKSWQPDFVVTTGDNNYPIGAANTIDDNIGKYYAEFIGNYHGAFGKGSTTNRFFPVLGNHDWYAPKVGCQAYLDYFTLPGNERYYEFTQGPLHFFMIDNDAHEPDGIKLKSKQHDWFTTAVAASTAPFQIVVAHHPPYSSGEHGGVTSAQWNLGKHGVELMLCGHDHNYERIERDGLTYIVNGAGGAHLRRFKKPIEGSQVRYQEKHGAMRFDLERTGEDWLLHARFVNLEGKEIDHFTVRRPVTGDKVAR